MSEIMTPNELPTFFTPAVWAQFNGDIKMLLVWAGPLIMLIVALFVAYGAVSIITGIFQKKKDKDKNDDDDYEVYRY
jgi:hypothetical protein